MPNVPHPPPRASLTDRHLEAFELQDVGARDLSPTADAYEDDELSEREIEELYVAEMERRDREAAAASGGGDDTDPTPPAGGGALRPESHPRYPTFRRLVRHWHGDVLIRGVADASDGLHHFGVLDGERDAWLAAATEELPGRLARTPPAPGNARSTLGRSRRPSVGRPPCAAGMRRRAASTFGTTAGARPVQPPPPGPRAGRRPRVRATSGWSQSDCGGGLICGPRRPEHNRWNRGGLFARMDKFAVARSGGA